MNGHPANGDGHFLLQTIKHHVNPMNLYLPHIPAKFDPDRQMLKFRLLLR